MANILTSNPIQLDTAGASSKVTTVFDIVGVIVIASADTWSCVLKDQYEANVIFRADSDLTNHRSVYFSPTKPIKVNGLYLTTATDIALVLVYWKPNIMKTS